MFKHIVWISAIVIAATAALFSVTGIATLFAGAFTTVAIMAAALELGKLVSASFLYRYWIHTPNALKTYLLGGVTALMFITSLGIYAYLTAAYAEVAAEPARVMNEIAFATTRQESLDQNILRYQSDLVTIDDRRLRVEGRLDSTLIGSTDLNQRSAWANTQSQIQDLDVQRTETQSRLESSVTERDSLELVKVQKRAALNEDSKVGTFIYIADIFNVELDDVVKWFTLIIVFVFDPLAVSLILAYNVIITTERPKPPKPSDAIGPPVEEEFPSSPEEPHSAPAEVQEPPQNVPETVQEPAQSDPINYGPYYLHPDYDWDGDRRWETDAEARLYRSKMQRVDKSR